MSDDGSIDFEYVQCRSCMPALARNTMINNGNSTLIKQVLENKYSHYLFVDYDVSWTVSAVKKLLKHHLPIVSAAYVSRSSNRCFNAGRYTLVPGNPGEWVGRQSKGLNEVDWVGAGFLLVEREALEQMEYPWFRHVTIPYMQPASIEDYVEYHQFECNEDVGFCMNAAAAGFKIVLDCDAYVNHNCEASVAPLQMTPPRSKFHIGKAPFVIEDLAGKVAGEYTNVPIIHTTTV